MTTESQEQLGTVLRNAYERLQKNELIVFCGLRLLQTTGTHSQLVKRLVDHDLSMYQPVPVVLQAASQDVPVHTPNNGNNIRKEEELIKSTLVPLLPLELVTEIVDHVGDWELSKAVGLSTRLPKPRTWERATPLDMAILSTKLSLVQATPGPFYSVSAKAAIRFSCVEIIEYLYSNHRTCYDRTFGKFLPLNASLDGSIAVLDWWKATPLQKNYDHAAMDGACLNGHISVLQWWVDSGLPLKYSDAALEHASARGHVSVLDWWTKSTLPLKIGRVMELASGMGQVEVLEWWHRSSLEFKYDRLALYYASCSGRVEALEWWAQSGLQMIYDSDALIGATRHNKPEALEWWSNSGLPIQYRLCDIEEALEDALGGGALVRAWWEKKGVDFRANFTEWTKYQSLV